jgi:hypothetical protein
MLAALIVIALVAAGFVSTFAAAVLAGQWNERRTAANQLGQQRLETLVSQPWTDVGLFTTNTGYRATANGGETTVNLSIGPHASSVPLPLATATIKNAAYTVRTDVTWTDDPADGVGAADATGTNDIKHISVSVSWSVGNRSSTVSFDDLRAANAVDVPPTLTTNAIGVTVTAPASQALASTGLISTAMTITAATTRTATAATLSYSNRSGRQTAAMTTTNGGTSWTVTLPTTTGPFDTGPVTFSVTATSSTSSGSGNAQVLMTLGANPITVSAAPGSQLLGVGNILTSAINVLVTSTKSITSGTVTFPYHLSTATRPLSGSGTSWSYTVPVDTTVYDIGTEIFTVAVVFSDSTTGSGTASLSLLDPTPPADITAVTVIDPYSTSNPVQSFCIKASNQTLWTATSIDARVSNVATTDTVQLNAPNYTGTAYYAMSYVSTNTDGSMNFRLIVAAGTVFPSGVGFIQIKVNARKTISGIVYADDFYTNINLQSVSNKTSCT